MGNEEKMVDCVEDLVGDAVPKVRVDHEYKPVMATSAHDLRREPQSCSLSKAGPVEHETKR
jgi:hypothetical protein